MTRLGTLLAASAMLCLLLVASSPAQHARHGRSMQHELGNASDLIGTKVDNQQGQNLGSVTDMVIDPSSGKVLYVVLSRGGVLGVGAKLYPVPWETLRYSDQNERFILNLGEDKLAGAPNFERDSWPDLSSSNWHQRVHSYYQQQGVVGGQGLGGTQGSAQQLQFDPNTVQMLSGRITNVSMSRMHQGLQQITLATEEGRTVVVDLAPPQVLHDRDIDLQVGDKVSVRGSLIGHAGRQHLVATQLRTDQGQVQLRGNQGQPLWQSQMQGQGEGQSYDHSQQRGSSSGDKYSDDKQYSDDKDESQLIVYQVVAYDAADAAQPSSRTGFIRASQLMDKSLQNPQGRRLADIDNLVIDTRTGKVEYAIFKAGGGFLGVGEKLHAVPWQALDYNPSRQTFVLNTTKDKLENAPSFKRDSWPDMSDRSWRDQLDRYYGAQSPQDGQYQQPDQGRFQGGAGGSGGQTDQY